MNIGMQTVKKTATGALLAIGVAGVAHASPIPVYVQEGSVAFPGETSHLGLHLLQSTSPSATPSSTAQNWDVYVSSVHLKVASSQNGPYQSELGFCADPWNWSGSGSASYFEDNLASMTASAGPTYDIQQLVANKSEIQSLYSNYYGGTVGNAANSAAFQLALWEIVSNNGVDKVWNTNTSIWNSAQDILTALAASHYAMGAQRFDLTALYVNRNLACNGVVGQNYLVATPVTVPAPAMLGLVAMAGFGLAGVAVRRRRRMMA
ncbi:putative uncharacterized protein [Burkholderiales bacterium GJ-E10]|nr:putative uncharacterized protein [Burkholderiales bacterium GJ-E10]